MNRVSFCNGGGKKEAENGLEGNMRGGARYDGVQTEAHLVAENGAADLVAL